MRELIGLVVCGGLSTRMGADKSLLKYHELPQYYHLYTLLEPLCEQVFVSCNQEQAKNIDLSYNFIMDGSPYKNIGPMAALLSAFDQFPHHSFLVVGCDYPFIQQNELKELLEQRNNIRQAMCYFNAKTNFEEPLLAIYENSCMPQMFKNFESGKVSLRHFLREISAEKINPPSLECIKSVNTPAQYMAAVKKINKRKPTC